MRYPREKCRLGWTRVEDNMRRGDMETRSLIASAAVSDRGYSALRHEVALPRARHMVDVPPVVLGDGGEAGLGLQDQFLVERLGAEFPPLRQFQDRAEGGEVVDRLAGTVLVGI